MTPAVDIADYCNLLLGVERFSDYCPNGLQVEGGRQIGRLLTGVTACQRLIDAAVEADADALLVHHGFFWKGEPAPLTGVKGRRIRTLLRADMSLLAYHLPLDAHPELGNNRQLGLRLGLLDAAPSSGADDLLWTGALAEPMTGAGFAERVEQALGREPLHIAVVDRPVHRVAWCTGAAQGAIERAAALGVDCYLSGEVSEQTVHLARELGVDYLAAGHHATERYGVQALGAEIAATFGIEHRFVEIDNPV
ncbi:Nif3-like dinuclear metal center hexameric protein [Lamprobacter modestohalophilus]|uniref:Nif3-like dinuclear metal center hexameric protein n=1 Tax=Lamprobacter modestohalophilus TaxID=1064514 RepID=UPI002ADECA3F|nr:Nif3-like dinuclear metal center hexameric protein [Lamprobacter modestohalophilus]MEA1049265.1 Nif3-like dinuclear metal center hexameric protein [Lamprobacter modestohalophilus]